MPSFSDRRHRPARCALLGALLSFGSIGAAPAAETPGDPNVAVHVIEKKQFPDRGKHELALYPAVVQVNGKYTQHIGTSLSYSYHLHENFALQLSPQYNWYARESSFSQELIDKVSQEPLAANSLLLLWGIEAGAEVTPIYGKFAFFRRHLVRFALVLNGGVGVGSTRHQLKPSNPAGPATYGDTGLKFLGSVGGGFRVQLGERFAIRLEIRDLVYTARVDRVNGCNAEDLAAMAARIDQGQGLAGISVSDGCRVGSFDGIDSRTNYNRSNDVPLALGLVSSRSSDVRHNVGFYAGLAFVY